MDLGLDKGRGKDYTSAIVGTILEFNDKTMFAHVSFSFPEIKPKPKYTSFLTLNYWWGKK